jgi:hypothetical protein
MAHFTKDRATISHPRCLELDKGVCPLKTVHARPGHQQPPLEVKINHQTAILRFIRNFRAGRGLLPSFSYCAKKTLSAPFLLLEDPYGRDPRSSFAPNYGPGSRLSAKVTWLAVRSGRASFSICHRRGFAALEQA